MYKIVVTGEHGGNYVPDRFKWIFQGQEEVLQTHRGIDIGSKIIFEEFKKIADYSKLNEISRLLVEVNRSPYHQKKLSEYSKQLNSNDKEFIIRNIYDPYRQEIEGNILSYWQQGFYVIHISVHTFTPKLDGSERNTDIGLLYDPARTDEKAFCKKWQKELAQEMPGFNVRCNYPYLGKADGFVTYLRKRFTQNYLGIELEVNQKHLDQIKDISGWLVSSFQRTERS